MTLVYLFAAAGAVGLAAVAWWVAGRVDADGADPVPAGVEGTVAGPGVPGPDGEPVAVAWVQVGAQVRTAGGASASRTVRDEVLGGPVTLVTDQGERQLEVDPRSDLRDYRIAEHTVDAIAGLAPAPEGYLVRVLAVRPGERVLVDDDGRLWRGGRAAQEARVARGAVGQGRLVRGLRATAGILLVVAAACVLATC